MDHRRSWPWKKKFSADKAFSAIESSSSSLPDQGNYRKPNCVQISSGAFSSPTGLKDQLKTLEDQVQKLNEKLTVALEEITAKDNSVKQHAKVAEEAVSGWEKAEAEALDLKNHLESVARSKLMSDDRASHLDTALKDCMQDIRNLNEEHELKLRETAANQVKHWEKSRRVLETKIENLEQALLHSAGENAALSRALAELNEEKSHGDAKIEQLKWNVESCERKINTLKYEHHIVSKELEIRNEEKNMSMKSADVANRQNFESVKKISKLESECHRLRGLIRKKLPGHAALTQMKLELDRDYVEFSFQNVQKCHKDNEFLSERLLAMEEETKMLREAMEMRDSELRDSRNIYAETLNKLQVLEARVQNNNQIFQKSNTVDSTSHLILMDDFLEMEKLAKFSNINKPDASEKLQYLDPFEIQLQHSESDIIKYSPSGKPLEDIKRIVQDTQDNTAVEISDYTIREISDHRSNPKISASFDELEQMKSDKDNLSMVYATCSESLENTKILLQEKEQLLEEVKLQLASAQKTSDLTETQLKCMAESYRSLEIRPSELETEINILRVQTKDLKNELQQERNSHHALLARCQDLQVQLKSMYYYCKKWDLF